MDAKILRKWGLKASDSKDSLPGSPVSQSSRDSHSGAPVDYRALQAWLPPIPLFERQRLSADVLQDLRYACAVVLKDTTPADADLDQTDPLEEYRKAIARAEQPEKPQESKVEQKTHKPRRDSPRAKDRQASKQAQMGGAALHSGSRDVYANDRLQSLEAMSGFPQPPKRETLKPSSSHQDHYKPPPHKAASPDYMVQESSRTSITNLGSGTTHSARDTAISSFSQSPLDTLRNSNVRSIGYPSNHPTPLDQMHVRPGSSSHANASHTVWITGGRSIREHENISALPPLRKSASNGSLMSQSGLRSRAESIRDGIKEYIRPGSASRSSSRPATSRSHHTPAFEQQEPPRPESQSSRKSETKRSWWRGGGLGRKASFTSNRNSTSSRNAQEPGSTDGEDGPNLDKSLPPMPGLDTYVEPAKEPKLHISQLMVPITPTPPNNSLASPANLTSPRAGPMSPPVLSRPQGSPHPIQTPQYSQTQSGTGRSKHSPALTPGKGSHTPAQPNQSRPKSKSSSQRPNDRKKSEHGQKSEHTQPRTFFSPAHQSATADMTQFSDAWREELAQKDAQRRLARERARQMAKEHKRRQLEAQGRSSSKDKESPGLKNRLSRMFGQSKLNARPKTAPEPVAEAMEPVEELPRGRGREVAAN